MFFNSLLLKFTEFKLKSSNNFKKKLLSASTDTFKFDKLTQNIYKSRVHLIKSDATLPTTLPVINKFTLENSVVLYLINTTSFNTIYNINFFYFYFLHNSLKLTLIYLLDVFKRTIGDGFIYIRGLFIIFFIDACLTDDEPI